MTFFYAFDWLYFFFFYWSSSFFFLFFFFCMFYTISKKTTSFFKAISGLILCIPSVDTVITVLSFSWNWSLLCFRQVFKLFLCWWTWLSLPYQNFHERIFLIWVLLLLPLRFAGGFLLELMCILFIKFIRVSLIQPIVSYLCVAPISNKNLFCWTRLVHQAINLCARIQKFDRLLKQESLPRPRNFVF